MRGSLANMTFHLLGKKKFVSSVLWTLALIIISGSTTRASAGTPQFQNLSGTIRTSANGLIPSNSSVNNVANSSNNRTTLTSLYHNSGSTNGNSAGSTSELNQAPSPSDSAVGYWGAMLKEKDTEINYLRETMEQNEQVIFKVSQRKWDDTSLEEIDDTSNLFDKLLNHTPPIGNPFLFFGLFYHVMCKRKRRL